MCPKFASFLCFFIPNKKKRRAMRTRLIWEGVARQMVHDEPLLKCGVTEIKRKPRVIVSLTSFPARIERLHAPIFSLLNQSMKPDEVVLWLGEDKFEDKKNLPQNLLELCDKGLTIKWTKDIRSYTKLVPALKEYPDDIIVTADDDIYYPKKWLEKLYNAYLKHPQYIHCHRSHTITFDKDGNVKNYHDWKRNDTATKPSYKNFLTGVGGVLYPPHCLAEPVLDQALFQELAPYADDIWFWAMAVLNKTKIHKLSGLLMKNLIQTPDSLEHNQALALINCQQGKNDTQMKAVLDHFPIIKERLAYEE